MIELTAYRSIMYQKSLTKKKKKKKNTLNQVTGVLENPLELSGKRKSICGFRFTGIELKDLYAEYQVPLITPI